MKGTENMYSQAMRVARKTLTIVALITLSACFGLTGPEQPTSGPGGTDYLFDFVAPVVTGGSLANKWAVYEPTLEENQRVPAPGPLPVIVFVHGYQLVPDPDDYKEFIEHLVKHGYIVIYPYYQVLLTLPRYYVNTATRGILGALDHITSNPLQHAQPLYDGDQMSLGMIGHSMGGVIAASLTANWQEQGIPRPLALMTLMAGSGGSNPPYHWLTRPIDPDTNMLVVVASEDATTEDEGSRSIWEHTSQIDNSRRDWILVKSDRYGDTEEDWIVADHLSPGTSNVVDALDYYGYWKWATALMNHTFFGTDGDYALGNTHNQRYMGTWADGQPVVEAEVYDHPVWP